MFPAGEKFIFVILFVAAACANGIRTDQLSSFERVPHEDCVIVQRAAIQYKKQKFPVFAAKVPGILDSDELIYHERGIRAMPSLCMIVDAGEVQKTVFDLLDFYSKNILEGLHIGRPTSIDGCTLAVHAKGCEVRFRESIEIWYLDDRRPYKGLFIGFPTVPGTKIIRSIDDIPFAQNGGWSHANRNNKGALIKWAPP